MYEDINSAFDHIANQVLEPMEKVANELASNYQDPNSNQPKSGFDPLSESIKQLPKQTGDALQSTVELSTATDMLGSLPLVNKLQALVSRAQTLMEDINSEATEFFGVSSSLLLNHKL